MVFDGEKFHLFFQRNSLGVQVGSRETLVVFFTYASEPYYQTMAYSTDGGET